MGSLLSVEESKEEKVKNDEERSKTVTEKTNMSYIRIFKEQELSAKFLMIGQYGVGKTSLLGRLHNHEFSTKNLFYLFVVEFSLSFSFEYHALCFCFSSSLHPSLPLSLISYVTKKRWYQS